MTGSPSSATASTRTSAWSTPSSTCATAAPSTSCAPRRPLVDRGDLSVGPVPGRGARTPAPPARGRRAHRAHVAMDVTWEGHIPAVEEPRQYMRSKGKVVFDTQRLAQTGCWSGTLSVGGTDLAVTPDRCWGTRDRSWGVRPVGRARDRRHPPGRARPRRHVELLPDAVRRPRHHVHLPRARRR